MTSILVQSFNGHEVNDGVIYSAYSMAGDQLFARSIKPITHQRMGRHPTFQRFDRTDARIPLRITIMGADSTDTIADRIDTLNGWFNLGQRGDLVVAFGASLRKVNAYVERVVPQDGSPNRFTAILHVPDPRWISDREVFFDNGGVSCSGDNLVTDSERDAGLEYDGLDKLTYGSTGIWPGHENLCYNSDALTNLKGWGSLAPSGSPTRSTGDFLFGSASVKVTVTAGSNTHLTFESDGVGVGNTFNAGKWYSAWAWVLLSNGWSGAGGGDLRIGQYRMSGATSSEEYFDAEAGHNGGTNWQFVQTIWYQDTTDTGGVRFDVQGSNPTGPGRTINVSGLNIVEFDNYADIVLGPNVLTDGAPDTHTYGLCTADASSYSTSQSWFMALVRAGWKKGWATRQARKHTVFSWYDDASNYIHGYYQESAGTAGAFVLERMNGGTLDTHTVDAPSPPDIDTLQTERDYVSVCFAWENDRLRISIDGAAFDEDTSISTNGLPAVVSPLVEIGSMSEGDQLCGDVVWAVAGSGTVTDAEAAILDAGGASGGGPAANIPTVFDSADAHFFSWDANDGTAGDGITEFSLYQNGNVPYDEARMVIQPRTQKAAADSWTISRDIVFANRVPRSFVNFAIDVTDGGLDTEAMVTAGDALSDGDDFRVLVDGIEVPRWFGEDTTASPSGNSFNRPGTTVWINVDLEPARTATLLTAAGSGDDTLTFDEGDLVGWPRSGFLAIGTECIRYTSRTDTVLSGCTRGQRGTTAASHSTDAEAYWVQRRVQLMYGYSGAPAPEERIDLKPVIDLDLSDNDHLVWDNFWSLFTDTTPRRSMQWARTLREIEALQNRFVITTISSGFALLFRFRKQGPVPGEIAANTATISLPGGTGDSGGDVISFLNSNDFSNRTSVYGIDVEGNRRFIGTYTPVSTAPVGNQLFDSPGDDLVTIDLQANLGRVFGSPQISSLLNDPPAVVVSLGNTPGQSHRQPFVVPASKEPGSGQIDGFSAWLKLTDNDAVAFNITVRCSLLKEDPANIGQYITLGTADVVMDETPYLSAEYYNARYFFFDAPVAVVPGDDLLVEIEYLSKASGSISGGLRWGGNVLSYNGAVQVMDFFGYSQSLDHDGVAELPVDGDGAGTNDINIWMNPDGVPLMILGAEETDAYFIDATLANATTGQSVAVEALVRVDDELEVDMGTGASANLTQDLSIANLTTFSDDDDLITLEPGENEITYTEADLVSVELQAYYRHVWQ